MSRKGQGRKRKSEDFICEIDPNDLSSDDDENVTSPSCKIRKIDGNFIKTSNIEETSSSNPCSESVILITDESGEMINKQSAVEEINLMSNNGDNSGVSNNESKPHNTDIIELDECVTENNASVILVEENIPVMIVSDDEVEEEGEIVEDLEIVDEVFQTPKPKAPANKTVQSTPILSDEEFHVVEEIGPSPLKLENDSENLINISFKCHQTMNQYGHLFVNFLQTFPEIKIVREKLSIRVVENESFEETKSPKKRNKKKKAKKDLFVVDTNPFSNKDTCQSLQMKYTSKFEISEQDQAENVGANSAAFSKSCFNCTGDHDLRDCPVPRNYNRINQARQQFQNKYKNVRYHLEQNQKLADFKPGVISESLRKALGLEENEVPGYIYKMRHLGYPPGWLEEAKITSSNLTLFDTEGEKMEEREKTKKLLDPTKIVEYPGFNVPLRKGIRDDYKRHNVRPYNKSMHKSSMIQFYEQECRNNEIKERNSRTETSPTVMKEKRSSEKTVKKENAAPADSSSLNELEKKKKELLEKLNSSEETSKSPPNNSENDTPPGTPDDKNKKDSVGVLKNSDFGTPILKTESPYSRLPKTENFSVGVSPVIDFENLPNSTGKYKDLTKVLSKVRMSMKDEL